MRYSGVKIKLQNSEGMRDELTQHDAETRWDYAKQTQFVEKYLGTQIKKCSNTITNCAGSLVASPRPRPLPERDSHLAADWNINACDSEAAE